MAHQQDLVVSPSRFWRSRKFGYEPPLPAPFRVRLDTTITHLWAGVVDEPGHAFDGQAVYLSQRRAEWNGEIDVEVSPRAQDGYFAGSGQASFRLSSPSGEGAAPPARSVAGSAPHDRLLALWAKPGQDYSRHVSHGAAEVASLAAHYGVRLPGDFRDYLIHACSTLDGGGIMDEFGNAWWGLERIRSLVEECGEQEANDVLAGASAAKALLFADTLIWCTAWGVCCEEGPDFGRVFLVSSGKRFVADSFAEFVARYVEDDRTLY